MSNALGLVDTLADTVPEMDGLSVGDKRGGAQALVDAMADTLPEMDAVTPGDALGDAYALNDLLGDRLRHTGLCAGSGQHAG